MAPSKKRGLKSPDNSSSNPQNHLPELPPKYIEQNPTVQQRLSETRNSYPSSPADQIASEPDTKPPVFNATITGTAPTANPSPEISSQKPATTRRKRQKYSRNGCAACKKRKIKCDEKLPICGRCDRLKMECIYYRVFKFQSGVAESHDITNAVSGITTNGIQIADSKESGGTINSDAVQHGATRSPNSSKSSLSAHINSNNNDRTSPLADFHQSHHSHNIDPHDMNQGLTELLLNQELLLGDIVGIDDFKSSYSATSNGKDDFHLPDFQNAEYFQTLDISMDPNSIHNSRETDTLMAPTSSPSTIHSNSQQSNEIPRPTIASHTSSGYFPRNDRATVLEYDYLENLNKSLSQAELNKIFFNFEISPNSFESIYLQVFIKDVHCIIFPLTTSFLESPFISSFLEQAKESPYLLNAMLASGARYLCEKAKIDKEEMLKKRDKYLDHNYLKTLDDHIQTYDKHRVHYLTNCFNSLKFVLESLKSLNIGLEHKDDIESALLTSLILAADLSSSKDQKWSMHLKGAKQFLQQCNNSQFSLSNNDCLALHFSKYLFSSLEISSGMAHPNGSSLDLDELDLWIPVPLNHGPVSQLSRFGLVIDGYRNSENVYGEYTGELECQIASFKVYMGFNDDVIEVVKQILYAKKKVNETSDGNGSVLPEHITIIMGLIHKASSFQIVVNTHPFLIPIQSKFHPFYDGVDKFKLPLSAYVYKSNLGQWFSFYDYSQQFRLNTLYLYILTHPKFLGIRINSPTVTSLVSKIINNSSIMISLRSNLTEKELQELEDHYNSNILISSDGVINFDTENTTFKLKVEALDKIVDEVNSRSDNFKMSDYLRDDPIDHRICMVQWCLLITGFSCLKATDKLIVDYLMHKLLLVGVKSANLIIDNVKRIWIQRRIRFNDKVSGRLFKLDDSFNHAFFGERNDTVFPFS